MEPLATVQAGTVFQSWSWPKDTWFQHRLWVVRHGIDPSIGDGEVDIDLGEKIVTVKIEAGRLEVLDKHRAAVVGN